MLSVLGLTSYPAAISNAVHTPALPHSVRPAASPGRHPEGQPDAADFASRYHLIPLTSGGSPGPGPDHRHRHAGQHADLDATHFWSTTLKIKTKANRIKLDNMDGGAGKVSLNAGSGETTLDVEQSGALAPDAGINVYQAPEHRRRVHRRVRHGGQPGPGQRGVVQLGRLGDLHRLQRGRPQGVRDLRPGVQRDLPELAAQGQSSFIAAGDDGAYDAFGDQASTNLSVDEPGTSPYTTDAGGTTLPGTIPVATGSARSSAASGPGAGTGCGRPGRSSAPTPRSRSWKQNIAGGGGGFSTVESAPFYRRTG